MVTTPWGGHAAFIAGRWPWRPLYWAEERAIEWLGEIQIRRASPATVVQPTVETLPPSGCCRTVTGLSPRSMRNGNRAVANTLSSDLRGGSQ